MKEKAEKVPDDFYPAPYHAADKKSILGQRRYKNLFRLELAILILAALVSIWPVIETADKQNAAFLLAVLFIAELVIRISIQSFKFQDDWYYGRAIAESIKTMTWKFAMRPYQISSPEGRENEREQFKNKILKILNVWENVGPGLIPQDDTAFLSDTFIEIKTMVDWKEKRDKYRKGRILEQRDWYEGRADKNKNLGDLYFVFVILCYGLALALSIYFIYFPNELNLVPVFTVLASSILGWTQLNNFKDLKNAYNVAKNEIVKIKDEMAKTTVDNFYQQVEDTENAFSREHTVWIARKDADAFSKTRKN